MIFRRTRNDRRGQLGIGRQHAVEADQVQARRRHQGGESARMNSSGDITTWVVPSLYELFRRSTTSPVRLRLSRPLAIAGRVM